METLGDLIKAWKARLTDPLVGRLVLTYVVLNWKSAYFLWHGGDDPTKAIGAAIGAHNGDAWWIAILIVAVWIGAYPVLRLGTMHVTAWWERRLLEAKTGLEHIAREQLHSEPEVQALARVNDQMAVALSRVFGTITSEQSTVRLVRCDLTEPVGKFAVKFNNKYVLPEMASRAKVPAREPLFLWHDLGDGRALGAGPNDFFLWPPEIEDAKIIEQAIDNNAYRAAAAPQAGGFGKVEMK